MGFKLNYLKKMNSKMTYLMAAACLLATVAAEKVTAENASVFRGSTPKTGWFGNMSPHNNTWNSTAVAGLLTGFIVFGLSYIYVVIYIFYDISKSHKSYLELVEDDRNVIRSLNVPKNMLE